MAKVKVVPNRAGHRAILRSDRVARDLKQRADKIARAAGDGMGVHTETASGRARAAVVTETASARRREAGSKTLTRSIGAGSG